MVLAAIEANFTCACGAPFIVMTLDPAPNDKITALLVCPRHRLGHHITLDHSGLDLWASVVADHLYRCAICGRELAPASDVSSSEVATTFTLNCPVHGTQKNTRTIWSVLHRRLLAEIQQKRITQSSSIEEEVTPKAVKVPVKAHESDLEPSFCPQCGHKIRTHDNFCFICGSAID
ncbi:MAG: zinc-ribbon domain-containing protein [Promethearchaeota archaeon]